MSVFMARYRGKCAGCGDGIEPGEAVEYVDDELVHEGCTPAPVPTPRPVCGTCFMEIALNGACGCEEDS